MVLGSRDGVSDLSDEELQKRYMDDLSGVAQAGDQFKSILKKLLGK